jgi:hypothetical protein
MVKFRKKKTIRNNFFLINQTFKIFLKLGGYIKPQITNVVSNLGGRWEVGLGFELRASHLQSRHSLELYLQSILLWLFWRQ